MHVAKSWQESCKYHSGCRSDSLSFEVTTSRATSHAAPSPPQAAAAGAGGVLLEAAFWLGGADSVASLGVNLSLSSALPAPSASPPAAGLFHLTAEVDARQLRMRTSGGAHAAFNASAATLECGVLVAGWNLLRLNISLGDQGGPSSPPLDSDSCQLSSASTTLPSAATVPGALERRVWTYQSFLRGTRFNTARSVQQAATLGRGAGRWRRGSTPCCRTWCRVRVVAPLLAGARGARRRASCCVARRRQAMTLTARLAVAAAAEKGHRGSVWRLWDWRRAARLGFVLTTCPCYLRTASHLCLVRTSSTRF